MTITTPPTKASKPAKSAKSAKAAKTAKPAKGAGKATAKSTKTLKAGDRAAEQTARQVAHVQPIRRLDPEQGIKSVQDLADHLYVAAQVELSTIPLYLFATYSIRTYGHSQWAAPLGALRSLVGISIEEMLHLALVRNLMVAIGHGNEIKFYDKDFIPKYPSLMMHRYNPDDPDGPEITLSLDHISTTQVSQFRRIEMPDDVSSDAQVYAAHPRAVGQYPSLGAFYRSIQQGFKDLQGKIKWDTADVRKQYKRAFWNEFGSGKPIRVYNMETALAALEIIIEQGEGSTGGHESFPVKPGVEELSHYEKFKRIQDGVEGIGAVDGTAENEISIDDPAASWPVVANPRAADFKDQPDIHALMTFFNAAYCYLLQLMDELYQHTTLDAKKKYFPGTEREELFSRRYGLERNGIALMQGILYPLAHTLMTTPITKGKHKGKHAAPSFEFHEFTNRMAVKAQLDGLFEEALKYFPVLGGPDGVQRQMGLLTEL